MANQNKKTIKPLTELTLASDFMFGQVMSEKTLCVEFLEELLGIKIKDIKYIQRQDDKSDTYGFHGIRLDIFLQDVDGNAFNIEMQASDNSCLERRARFYQSGIDREILKKGVDYKVLPKSVVIFVCNYDYYKEGLAVYKRESHIKNTRIPYDDGSEVYILNSEYSVKNTTDPILEFLQCVNGKLDGFSTNFAQNVAQAVKNVRADKNKEGLYMTFAMKMRDMQNLGYSEGYEDAKKKQISM